MIKPVNQMVLGVLVTRRGCLCPSPVRQQCFTWLPRWLPPPAPSAQRSSLRDEPSAWLSRQRGSWCALLLLSCPVGAQLPGTGGLKAMTPRLKYLLYFHSPLPSSSVCCTISLSNYPSVQLQILLLRATLHILCI